MGNIRTAAGVLYLKDLFVQVALVQLRSRQGGVLTGTATGQAKVSQDFLNDVSTITTAIAQSAYEYSIAPVPEKQSEPQKSEPQYLAEARQSFQQAVEECVEQNAETLTSLKD